MKKLLLFLSLVISACGLQDRNCDDQIINSTPDMKESQADLSNPDLSKPFICTDKTRFDPNKTLIRNSYLTDSKEWLFDCKLNTYCQKYKPSNENNSYCWPYYDGQDWNKDDTNSHFFDDQLIKIYSGVVYRTIQEGAFIKGSILGDSNYYIFDPYTYGDKIYFIGDILYQF